MDSLGALALASEPPEEKLLQRPPYGRNASVFTLQMVANIIGQAVYQLTVVMIILFAGAGSSNEKYGDDGSFPGESRLIKDRAAGGLWNLKSANHSRIHDDISVHYTFIFNSFVFMQFGNWINARKLYHEMNVFKGMHRNVLFISIWIFCVFLQVIIIEIPKWANPDGDCENPAVKTKCLPLKLWGYSILFGVCSWVWQFVIIGTTRCLWPNRRPLDIVVTRTQTITATPKPAIDSTEDLTCLALPSSGNLRGMLSNASLGSGLNPAARNPRRQHDFDALIAPRRSGRFLIPSGSNVQVLTRLSNEVSGDMRL